MGARGARYWRALTPLVLAACSGPPAAPDALPAPPPEPPALAGAGDQVFVSQAGSSTIAVIDGASGTTRTRIEVGMLPHNLILSPDRRTLYVALVGSQAVAEVDVPSARLRRTMLTAPLPEKGTSGTVIEAHRDPRALAATTCYGCHHPGGAQPKYAGDRPFGMLLSPDGQRLLVTHLKGGQLAVLDLAQGRLERSVPLPPAGPASEAVAIDRLGDELWVAMRPQQPSLLPGAVRRLDADTFEARGDLPTGSDPGMLLALPQQRRVLVSNFETDTVTIFDGTGPGLVTHWTAAPGPLGLLALPGARVLALGYYSNAVSFLALDTGATRTIPLVRGGVRYANPTNAALSSDGRTAWVVSSGTDGHLLALDLTTGAVVRDLPIDGLSFGVAAVPGSAP